MMEGFEHTEKCHIFLKISDFHGSGSGMTEDDRNTA
jgi:hypothetical protein